MPVQQAQSTGTGGPGGGYIPSPAVDPRKPPRSKPGALALQQVINLARAKNPIILAAEQNLRAVRAQELQADARANPFFGVNGTNVTLPPDGSKGNPDAYALQFSRLFERGNKRGYRLETARATTAQTQAQLGDTIRQTVLQIKLAFVRMLFAKASLDLATANLNDFRHQIEVANDRYQAGDIGKLDFERLDLQLGNFESDQANATIIVLQASDQLQTFIGNDTPKPDFDITRDYLDALREARITTSDALDGYSTTWQSIHALSAATATELGP